MITLADRLGAAGGRPVGFDYLRLALSTAVLSWHSIVTSYGSTVQAHAASGLNRAPSALIIPVFFCLSGFLVMGSLERSRTVVSFMGLRALRIYPSLIIVVLVSTLVVGPLLTDLPLRAYAADPRTWRYLFGLTGAVGDQLPGVFAANPNPGRVNGALWTIPFDLACYALVALLGALGVLRRRRLLLAGVMLLWGSALLLVAYRQPQGTGHNNVTGVFLFAYFLFGSCAYVFRDRLPWSGHLAMLCGAVTIGLLSWPPYGDLLAAPTAAYLTAYLGLLDPPKLWFIRGADFSYGVFIYGYLVQQCWMTLGPAVHHWWINLALTLPTVWTLAAISWFGIERPVLRRRTLLFALEARWLRRRTVFVDAATRLGRLRPPRRLGDG